MSYAREEEERKQQQKSKAVKAPKRKVTTRKSLQAKGKNRPSELDNIHQPTSVSFANTTPEEPTDYPTIEVGMEYINSFLDIITQIFYDTQQLVWTENSMLAGIGRRHMNEVYNSYMAIHQKVNEYLNSGIPAGIIAQAIADNVELDYTIAIAIQPPSDIIVLFDHTYEQLEGIWSQINDMVEQRAQQMEDEYYGR